MSKRGARRPPVEQWAGWLRRIGAGLPADRQWQQVATASTERACLLATEAARLARPWCLAEWCALRVGLTPQQVFRRRLKVAG